MMEWLKDHVKEVVFGLMSTAGLAVVGFVSRFARLYCDLLQLNPIACYDDYMIKYAWYFILPAIISILITWIIGSVYAWIIAGIVAGILFLSLTTAARFLTTSEYSVLFVQWALVVPLQFLSGVFAGSLLGGLAHVIWTRMQASIIAAAERLLGKVGKA